MIAGYGKERVIHSPAAGNMHNYSEIGDIVQKEQIIAIGDNENDVEMFKEAGISVAMENAKDPVKQQADFVAADNDHDGAAEFLEKFLKL